jgi:SAM-dependent methyltransferase
MTTLLSKTLKTIARGFDGPSPPAMATVRTHTPITSISGHFYPYLEADRTRVVAKTGPPPCLDPEDGLPIPPRELHVGYGSDLASYIASGREQHHTMMEIIKESGWVLGDAERILDFGCAAGRMIRCFASQAEDHEVWGVDIRAEHILWCQRNLSPPFRFATTTTYPHLPFEDNFFSFIYACSVFTHIGDLEDSWLLELRRVLRPGGRLFATVSDNHAIDVVVSSPPGHWLHTFPFRHKILEVDSRYDILKSGFDMVSVNLGEPGNALVLHDREFLCRRWGQFLKIHSIHPEAHGYQTAIVMVK